MIKVLHYLRHLGLGGTEKTAQLFFEHASKDKFEVAVAYEKNGEHPRLEEFEKSAAVCHGRLIPINSWANKLPDSTELQYVINNFKPDILHVYQSGYEEFPRPGIHVEVPHFVITNVFGFVDINPRIDRDLFMSQWLMYYAARNYGPRHGRFDFVNNPVELPFTDAKLPIAHKWHDEGAIILGRCGRPDNGIYNAINVQAAHILRLQGIDVRFIVVAPPSNMIKDLVELEIPFHVIEPTTNPLVLSMFYNSIDIYAHARADGETFGVNIAEAMIHSKPVVTHTAMPSFPGMGVFQAQTTLVDNQKTGFVVPNDKIDYSDALKLLCKAPFARDKMGEEAYEKALKEFSVDVCIQKLEKIYEEICI